MSGKWELTSVTGKGLLTATSGKAGVSSDCCCPGDPCVSCSDSSSTGASDGGDTPFDWGDTCTWMTDATYGGSSFAATSSDCTWSYGQLYVDGGEPNPQGVTVDVVYDKSAKTWSVRATAADNRVIYAVHGLSRLTFACPGDATHFTGDLTGTATLQGSDCTGVPDATFSL